MPDPGQAHVQESGSPELSVPADLQRDYKPFAGYASQQLYKMEHGAFKGYMGDKRKRLVEKHGYDTKNAAHLIRLLRMGTEFLRDGELNVLRYDASELLAIKHGEWSLEKIKAEAERLFRRAEEACDRSTLPAGPDREAILDDLDAEVVDGTGARLPMICEAKPRGSWSR